MAVADLSRDVVEERLGALEEAYASFTVNQTTLSVAPETYQRARDRFTEGLADAYVQVYDDGDDVLLVEGEREWVVPSVSPPSDDPLERGVSRAVADHTGVECAVTDLERVTILGVCDQEEPERATVYRLVAVFTAERTGGAPEENAEWHSDLPDSALPRY
jgi:ADP-ribose pyrophosphatase YjhB (NUDIX family)